MNTTDIAAAAGFLLVGDRRAVFAGRRTRPLARPSGSDRRSSLSCIGGPLKMALIMSEICVPAGG